MHRKIILDVRLRHTGARKFIAFPQASREAKRTVARSCTAKFSSDSMALLTLGTRGVASGARKTVVTAPINRLFSSVLFFMWCRQTARIVVGELPRTFPNPHRIEEGCRLIHDPEYPRDDFSKLVHKAGTAGLRKESDSENSGEFRA